MTTITTADVTRLEVACRNNETIEITLGRALEIKNLMLGSDVHAHAVRLGNAAVNAARKTDYEPGRVITVDVALLEPLLAPLYGAARRHR